MIMTKHGPWWLFTWDAGDGVEGFVDLRHVELAQVSDLGSVLIALLNGEQARITCGSKDEAQMVLGTMVIRLAQGAS